MAGHDSEGCKIQCSPISARPSGANTGANDINTRNANSETTQAAGVEEPVSVLQSQVSPPVLEESNEKYNRKRTNQSSRANDAKALRRNRGSRLVRNKSLTARNGANNRTCLLDSIITISPPTKNRELVDQQ